MSSLAVGGRGRRGFSMVELLVTVIIAGIIFAAMVPFFANALGRTSEDELRVDATNIAQDRIEQTRLLAFADITSANLNYLPPPTTSPFGDGRFGQTYTLVGENKPYHIEYVVATPTASPSTSAKHVTVKVSRAGSSYVTTADTIIQNAAAVDETVSEAEPTGLTLTVYFDTYAYVDGAGVVLKRLHTTDNTTTTIAPVSPPGHFPNVTYPEVKFIDLIGGPNYTYSVFCDSSKATYTMAAPPFRMWSSGKLKFDTYPGGD
jgi:prepilin-type N-terminal cleavage/methylation domain-containing protein